MSTSQSLEDRARDVAAAAREALATPAAPVTPVEKCGMCGGTCDPRPSWVCRSCGEAHWKTAPVTPVELTHEESTDGGKTWRSVATPASGDIPLRYGVLVRKAAPAPVTPKESTTKEYRKGLRAGLDKAWGIVNRERVEGGEQEAFRVRARDAIFAELEANAPAVTPKGEPRAAFDEGVRWAATYVRQRGLRFKQHVNDPYTANALLTLADELADHGKTPPSEPQGEAPPAPAKVTPLAAVLMVACPKCGAARGLLCTKTADGEPAVCAQREVEGRKWLSGPHGYKHAEAAPPAPAADAEECELISRVDSHGMRQVTARCLKTGRGSCGAASDLPRCNETEAKGGWAKFPGETADRRAVRYLDENCKEHKHRVRSASAAPTSTLPPCRAGEVPELNTSECIDPAQCSQPREPSGERVCLAGHCDDFGPMIPMPKPMASSAPTEELPRADVPRGPKATCARCKTQPVRGANVWCDDCIVTAPASEQAKFIADEDAARLRSASAAPTEETRGLPGVATAEAVARMAASLVVDGPMSNSTGRLAAPPGGSSPPECGRTYPSKHSGITMTCLREPGHAPVEGACLGPDGPRETVTGGGSSPGSEEPFEELRSGRGREASLAVARWLAWKATGKAFDDMSDWGQDRYLEEARALLLADRDAVVSRARLEGRAEAFKEAEAEILRAADIWRRPPGALPREAEILDYAARLVAAEARRLSSTTETRTGGGK